MNKKENKKTIGIIVLAFVVGVVCATIAFATTTTILKLGGTGTQAVMDPISWKVKFDNTYNIQTNTTINGTATVEDYPSIISDSTIDDFKVTLKKTGDSILFKIKIVNEGVLDAKIDSVSLGTFTCTGTAPTAVADEAIVCDPDNMKLTLTYDGGPTPVEQWTTGTDNLLAQGNSVIVNLKLEYVGTTLPTNPVTISIGNTLITYTEQ